MTKLEANILKKLDKLDSFDSKLEYLNNMFLKAKTEKDEELVLDMIKRLKNGF